jgi:hypothetical protein
MTKILLVFCLLAINLVYAGDKRIGDTCHIQNDCESFCCSADDGNKGKCVNFETRETCRKRGEVDEAVLWVSVILIVITVVICAILKVTQIRKYDS